MKKAILIAEKPDLMRKIKSVYDKHKDDIGIDIYFLSQRGHLITLLKPSEMDPALEEWKWDTLPIFPEEHGGWKYKIIDEKKKSEKYMTAKERYEKIQNALHSIRIDFIINAGDPDAEGELLIRSVLSHMKVKGLPIKRFWTNDLTEHHILNALKNLRDDDTEPMLVHLLESAYLRQHTDFLYGMNISRAASLQMQGNISCGRVKTPLLGIVCKREEEIATFVPETTYGIRAVYAEGFDGNLFNADIENKNDSDEEDAFIRFKSQKEAENKIKELGNDGEIISCETKKQEIYAPKLYKLATLQIAAGKKGYDDKETGDALQKLYEAGFVSYPRTDCEYLSSNESFRDYLSAVSEAGLFKNVIDDVSDRDIERVKGTHVWVNDEKLEESGHSALRPTAKAPDMEMLSRCERDIYTMIARQFVAIFMPPQVVKKTTIITDIDGYLFRSRGKTLIDEGYTKLFDKHTNDVFIPPHKKGDELSVKEYSVTSRTTTCPRRFTSPELIAVCENPQKYLTDNSLKESGKKLKIGTPATRSGIIQELIHKNKYMEIVKEGNRNVLVPTSTGNLIMQNMKEIDICKVDMTALLEEQLDLVRAGKTSSKKAEDIVRSNVADMVQKIKNMKMIKMGGGSKFLSVCACPICGKMVLRGEKRYFCRGWKEGCATSIPVSWYGNEINEDDVKDMLGGKTIYKKVKYRDISWVQDMSVDSKGRYSARLPMENYDSTCCVCGNPVVVTPISYMCTGVRDKTCGMRIEKRMGTNIPEEEVRRFFRSGKTNIISGLKGSSGKEFSAAIVYDREQKKTKFEFAEKVIETGFTCPCCDKGKIEQKGMFYVCTNSICGFRQYCKPAGTELTKENLRDLFTRGKTKEKLSFKKKDGTKFKAYLALDKESRQFNFDFSGEKHLSQYACPICGKRMVEDDESISCECGTYIRKILAGKILSEKVIHDILRKGASDMITGFKKRKGGTFSAVVYFDKEDKKVKFQ